MPPIENPCHYGWDIAQIKDKKWIPVILGIHDGSLPADERLRLAKQVLRSDYRLAWYMVMALYNYIESLERWGEVRNWLTALSGPLRLKAIKVLQAPAGYGGATWDMAMMVLASFCKAKDAPVILLDMRRSIHGPLGVHWTALHRIVAWEPATEHPEIFEYLRELILSKSSPETIAAVQELLKGSTHSQARELLEQSVKTIPAP